MQPNRIFDERAEVPKPTFARPCGFRSLPVSCFSSPPSSFSSRSEPACTLRTSSWPVRSGLPGARLRRVSVCRAWFYERKRVYDTPRELSSFTGTRFDGILILDDRGVCLDANPRVRDLGSSARRAWWAARSVNFERPATV